jgi:hypothetical protein
MPATAHGAQVATYDSTKLLRDARVHASLLLAAFMVFMPLGMLVARHRCSQGLLPLGGAWG